jgi:hypothetical protein
VWKVDQQRIDGEENSVRAKLNQTHRRAMELLERCIVEQGEPAPLSGEYPKGAITVPMESWRIFCLKGGLSPGGNEESAKTAFRRAVKDLVSMRRIGVWDDLVWIAYN